MKKLFMITFVFMLFSHTANAVSHTVQKGESMWKIAVKYEVGLSELKSENPDIKNPELIYPGQIINIPVVNESVLNYEREVVRLVNDIRVKNGLNKFVYDWELSRVARYKSQDMRDNNYFSHTSPIYGSPFEMMKNFGISYKSAGENIARGQKTPQSVVDAWMNSKGHRENILKPSYNTIGVGYVKDGNYWTQMFREK